MRPSYLYDRNLYAGETASLYWDGPKKAKDLTLYIDLQKRCQNDVQLMSIMEDLCYVGTDVTTTTKLSTTQHNTTMYRFCRVYCILHNDIHVPMWIQGVDLMFKPFNVGVHYGQGLTLSIWFTCPSGTWFWNLHALQKFSHAQPIFVRAL